jgi:molybdenum cofactor cytidylyltransferase
MSDTRTPSTTGEDCIASIIAIVPAAGRSRRMGRPKQMLEVGGRPMLERVVDTMRAAGIERVVVVTNSETEQALRLSGRPGLSVVINDDAASEMIDSVRLGLAEAEKQSPGTDGGFLVLPADVAAVEAAAVRLCLQRFAQDPSRLVIASHAGRAGHPLIVPRDLAAAVHSRACDAGLRELARTCPQRVVLAECPSDSVLRDVDTPQDYDGLSGPAPA